VGEAGFLHNTCRPFMERSLHSGPLASTGHMLWLSWGWGGGGAVRSGLIDDRIVETGMAVAV
jgi:hypothetical protein